MLDAFLAGFSPEEIRIVIFGNHRFNVGVDITELAAKPDADLVVSSGIVFLDVGQNAFANSDFDVLRYFLSAGMGSSKSLIYVRANKKAPLEKKGASEFF